MGQIITIASGKGGCAKTSLAMLLSGTLVSDGYRVAVIDADPNACYFQWHKLYEGPAIDCSCEIRQEEIVDFAQEKAAGFEVVLIDTAGFGNTTAAFAAGSADLVLIPVMPDRASAVEAMRTARQVQAFGKAGRREIPLRIVRSRWNPRGLVERAIISDLEAAGLPILEQYLSDLSDFGKLSLSGKIPLGGKLGAQARLLVAELVSSAALPSSPARRAA